ncbi:MAG: hypothetical protein IPJ65_07070 [Archangiaceae bacterium]|nr:hypothetical protein [Archangiaceae bacterium]
MRGALLGFALAAVAGCECDTHTCIGDACMMMPDPPQVFLVATSQNVVGRAFTVSVNVTGCDRVAVLQLQQNATTFKTATYRGPNTVIEVVPGDLKQFYSAVGIAANLTLRAHVECDDARHNESQPVAITFFPVESVLQPTIAQGIVLPDSFIAEGGAGSTPTSFVGCATSGAGLSLARVNLAGDVVSINASLPFGCTYFASISEKVQSTGQRWLYEAGKGAFAFTTNGGSPGDLDVTGGIIGDTLDVFAVGPDGDALIWDSSVSTGPALSKIRHGSGLAFPNNTAWFSMTPGVLNGTPGFDASSGAALIPSWRAGFGSTMGSQTIQFVNYATGGAPFAESVLVTQNFAFLDPQTPPAVALSPDTRTVYIVVPVTNSTTQTQVLACGTQGGVSACPQRWRSVAVPGVIAYLFPFAGGSKVAGIGSHQIWFFDNADGHILNPNGTAATSSGALTISGAQPGSGNDFYILAGTPFASEIVAFDNPVNGEVWRYSMQGGGNTAQNALTIAIDEGGTSWLRIGKNQVKPLTLTEYRTARTP